ncbi:unnamed protein product [Anisakis simplex]|uniref:Polynucleotide 5'-hydroxyl-kinase nol-9 (inferred by orthology to a C. elegans protein) n=1 Tax=Anisakis simplex TaxID=6269 RepID=A0A0M3J1L8_ANISI|nr:unnamed protein product [Anisakis simplex]
MSADSIGNVRQQIANGSFFPCRRPDLRMALLENNQKYDFYGVFDIQVLFGSVEARGYNFESSAYNEKKFISICAPYVMGPPIVISTKSSENTFNVNRLKWRIQEVSDASVELLDLYKGGDAIVLLRFHIPKAALCVRNLYDVKFFVPSSGDYLMLETLCCVSKSRSRKVLENEHLSSVVNYLKKRRSELPYPFVAFSTLICLIMS